MQPDQATTAAAGPRVESSDAYPGLKRLEENWQIIAEEAVAARDRMLKWINQDIYVGDWRVGPFYRHTRRIDGIWNRTCPKTSALLDACAQDPTLGLVSAAFSLFPAGSRTHPHHNDDEYAYRGHMGLKVPEGDVGIDIAGKVFRWPHGQFFVWDPTDLHVAWNATQEDRYILIVDVFRPEHPRQSMIELMHTITSRTRAKRPRSLGFSGHLVTDGSED